MHDQDTAIPTDLTRTVLNRARAVIADAGEDPDQLELVDGRLMVCDLVAVARRIGFCASRVLAF